MFYCPRCADELKLRPAMPTTDFIGTRYQREKHRKHTTPDPSYRVQTVFDSTTTEYYQECVEEAYRLGAVELGDQGRNIVFCPSTQSDIGSKFIWGEFADRQDTVLVVGTTHPNKVHAFLEASSNFSTNTCQNCGGPLF